MHRFADKRTALKAVEAKVAASSTTRDALRPMKSSPHVA